ncbi:hypothetical protein C2845_PM05G22650 [Panicum miliaceum]|uniref:Uncharacterized protein n=1 Tax=Panicum miliaceum TaxID=4540 RepID=A0A3L6SV08_PANMI|nr:hypothetical protein C2845_PM05G22650 [Panicum miliaceum]
MWRQFQVQLQSKVKSQRCPCHSPCKRQVADNGSKLVCETHRDALRISVCILTSLPLHGHHICAWSCLLGIQSIAD